MNVACVSLSDTVRDVDKRKLKRKKDASVFASDFRFDSLHIYHLDSLEMVTINDNELKG